MGCLLALAVPVFAQESIPLDSQAPDPVAQARADGVPDEFLDAGAVTASIVRYDRALAEILPGLTGKLSYLTQDRQHILFRSLHDPDTGESLAVEYTFTVMENRELLLEKISINGRQADPYGEFFQYSDELCRKRGNQAAP